MQRIYPHYALIIITTDINTLLLALSEGNYHITRFFSNEL